MSEGQLVYKIALKNGIRCPKRMFLHQNNLIYRQADCNRKIRHLKLEDVQEVKSGSFDFITKSNKQIDCQDDLAFSVILSKRPYFFVTTDSQSRDKWVRGIRMIKQDAFKFSIDLSKVQKEFLQLINSFSEEQLDDTQIQIQKLQKQLSQGQQTNQKLILQLENKDQIIQQLQSELKALTHQNTSLETSSIFQLQAIDRELNQFKKKYKQAKQQSEIIKNQYELNYNNKMSKQYKRLNNSQEVMNRYSQLQQQKFDELENELALWQAISYMYALPLFNAKHSTRIASLKEVLQFAMQDIEKKLKTNQLQQRFENLMEQSRASFKAYTRNKK